jgi:hypothetical protein
MPVQSMGSGRIETINRTLRAAEPPLTVTIATFCLSTQSRASAPILPGDVPCEDGARGNCAEHKRKAWHCTANFGYKNT